MFVSFVACQELPSVLIDTNPVKKTPDTHYVKVQEGQDLNLTCYVSAMDRFATVYWKSNCADKNRCDDHELPYDPANCILSTMLSIYNVNISDNCTYTCRVPNTVPKIPPKSIDVIVILNGEDNALTSLTIYMYIL